MKDNYLTDAELTNDGFKLLKEIKNYHGSLMLTKTCQNLTIDLDHNVERKTKLEIVLVSSCDSSWSKNNNKSIWICKLCTYLSFFFSKS